ncbi:rhomboid family intramembrane serine protease [Clostridium frigidicarnis]|uniref:Membrane associated serine protease, rhomboid family n=1 Tax=Clostridium frigidicarnis TaxID=84698 RepID=A0A1I0XWF2_9CLOT|nr:hypothetical protein [Clostridium frigidicarnis]SFB05395.1 Membrane associated serine protease, rhomboid family [Clostridium frigidicarnis]
MKWLDKLDSKFGKFAIKNLMLYIIIANAIIYFVIFFMGRTDIVQFLYLDTGKVMSGEIWRLFTFVLLPPMTSPFFLVFALYFYYLAGNGLEHQWGSFKFNFYYFSGMIGIIIASFITGGISNATFLNLSLFLAFARLYPDYEILLFFILPIPVRYMAIFNWLYMGYNFIFSDNQYRILIVFCLLNYFVFFGKEIVVSTKNKKRSHRYKAATETYVNSKNYIHKCEVCGITDVDNPNMEFRYCSKCNGHYEYCIDHLKNHEHKK